MRCIVKVHHIADQSGNQTNVLFPAYETDQEVFDSLKRGNMYKADIRRARNPDHHRKGMALIRLIFENQEKYQILEDLLVELKLRVGWYREHVRWDGQIWYIPKSISFADMDQLEFEAFYDAVIDVALQDYGLKEALDFIGAKKRVTEGVGDDE